MAGGDALITRGEAMQIAEEVVANPGAPIEPRERSGDCVAGAAGTAGRERAGGARPAQARAVDHHLRRPARRGCATSSPASAARRRRRGCVRATRSCWSTSSRTPTRSSGRSCSARSGRRVDAGADRRPETGDLRLPRRRRLLLPVGRRDRRRARHAGGQLPLRPGADRRLRRDVRRRQARARGDRLPARPGGPRAPGVAAGGGAGRLAAARARGRSERPGARDHAPGLRRR